MATIARSLRAPRGTSLTCQGWPQEAALRMLMNNLDPDVAERPDDLVVYGGSGEAGRGWAGVLCLAAGHQRAGGGGTRGLPSRGAGGGPRPPPSAARARRWGATPAAPRA